jgi:DNA (cytosine-5)-methyltransferase 1
MNVMVDQQSLNELALFAGAGGGILGGHLLGWRTICAVEWEPYPASVLCARQNEGLLPPFPIWDDIQTFDGKPWRGLVDVVSGGFPCQDISAAGKGVGIDGERSGMWREMARVIREVGPRFVFVENSPMLTSRGLGAVLGDLASMGFDAKWGVLGAADVGANHQRDRIWIRGEATNPNSIGLQKSTHKCQLESQGSNQLQVEQSRDTSEMGDTHNNGQFATEICSSSTQRSDSSSTRQEQTCQLEGSSEQYAYVADTSSQRSKARSTDSQGGQERISNELNYSSDDLAYTSDKGDVWREWELGFVEQEHNSGRGSIDGRREWWATEPDLGRVAHGIPARVDRLKAIGNAQVPLCAATAWRILK